MLRMSHLAAINLVRRDGFTQNMYLYVEVGIYPLPTLNSRLEYFEHWIQTPLEDESTK